MLQIAELSYFEQNPGQADSVWFPDNDAEESKMKALQALLGVPETGDFDTATVKAIRSRQPKYLFYSRKSIIADLDKIIESLTPAETTTDAEKKTTDSKPASAPWYSRYKWYLAAGGVVTVAGLIIAKKKGMF